MTFVKFREVMVLIPDESLLFYIWRLILFECTEINSLLYINKNQHLFHRMVCRQVSWYDVRQIPGGHGIDTLENYFILNTIFEEEHMYTKFGLTS